MANTFNFYDLNKVGKIIKRVNPLKITFGDDPYDLSKRKYRPPTTAEPQSTKI